MNDLSGGIGSFLSPQRMQEGGAIDENTNLGGVATPQVITVGMDMPVRCEISARESILLIKGSKAT